MFNLKFRLSPQDVLGCTSRHPAQSGFEYPRICSSELLWSMRPLQGLYFKYLITLQAAW